MLKYGRFEPLDAVMDNDSTKTEKPSSIHEEAADEKRQ
jgi:hypothetical protein